MLVSFWKLMALSTLRPFPYVIFTAYGGDKYKSLHRESCTPFQYMNDCQWLLTSFTKRDITSSRQSSRVIFFVPDSPTCQRYFGRLVGLVSPLPRLFLFCFVFCLMRVFDTFSIAWLNVSSALKIDEEKGRLSVLFSLQYSLRHLRITNHHYIIYDPWSLKV